MARIRTIKPEILEDAKAAGLSDAAWRLWVSMWLLADDFGNLRGDSRRLAATVFWGASAPPDVVELLDELSTAHLVLRYTVRGQEYVSIVNWSKHQRIDNAGKTSIPGPGDADGLLDFAEARREPPTLAAGPGPGIGPGRDLLSACADEPASEPGFDFEAAYALYPRKEGKARGMALARKAIRSRAQYDRLLAAVRNYAASDAVRDGFVMLWSTFMAGRWEDYVDGPVAKAQPVAAPRPPVWRPGMPRYADE